MVAQKREIHIEMSRDTLLFTLHESCIAIPNAILPKCVSTNLDIKGPLLFLAHHRYINLHDRCITIPLQKESSKTQEHTL